jgi:hypothetical protein
MLGRKLFQKFPGRNTQMAFQPQYVIWGQELIYILAAFIEARNAGIAGKFKWFVQR